MATNLWQPICVGFFHRTDFLRHASGYWLVAQPGGLTLGFVLHLIIVHAGVDYPPPNNGISAYRLPLSVFTQQSSSVNNSSQKTSALAAKARSITHHSVQPSAPPRLYYQKDGHSGAGNTSRVVTWSHGHADRKRCLRGSSVDRWSFSYFRVRRTETAAMIVETEATLCWILYCHYGSQY